MKTPIIGTDAEGSAVRIDPARLISTRMLVQANSGGGKSWMLRVLCERLGASIPIIILDWEGEFASLREKLDVLLVGRDGEVPTAVATAGALATQILEIGVSAIIDLYDLNPHEKRAYVRRFLESLMAAPKRLWTPRIVVVDEAHNLAPEDGEAESRDAVESLCSAGRKRQFCAICATQRLSKLAKDAAAELNNVLIGRCTLDVDQKRAADILGFAKPDRVLLRDLEPGEFYAFGPAFNFKGVQKIKSSDVQTTHGAKAGTSKPPEPSARMRGAIEKLQDLAERAKTEVLDLDSARSTIKGLRQQLAKAEKSAASAPTATEPSPKAAELREARAAVAKLTKIQEELVKFIINIQARDFCEGTAVDPEKLEAAVRQATERATQMIEASLKARSEAIRRLKADAAKLVDRAGAISAGLPKQVTVDVAVTRNKPFSVTTRPVPPARPRPENNGHAAGISKPYAKILESAAFWKSVGLDSPTVAQLAAAAGYAPSGTFDTYLSRMGTEGLLARDSGRVTLTDAGWQNAPSIDEPPSLSELHDRLMTILDGPSQKIMQALIERSGEQTTVADLAAASGYAESGTFDTYLSRLGTKGFIVRKSGIVRPTEVVFPDGLS